MGFVGNLNFDLIYAVLRMKSGFLGFKIRYFDLVDGEYVCFYFFTFFV